MQSTNILGSAKEFLQKSAEIEVLNNINDKDSVELKTLLTSWNVSVLFEYFRNQQLFVEVLRHFPDQLALNIFKGTNFSLGVQGEFIHNWTQWKASQQAPQSTQIIPSDPLNIAQTTTKRLSSTFYSECANTSPKDHKSNEINLHNILSKDISPYGEVIIKQYKKNGKLDENTRKLLVEVFLQFCISRNILHVTKEQCKHLAEEIANTFQGEAMGYYYVDRRGAPLGKLYNKFHNWKSNKVVKPAKLSDEPKTKTSVKYEVNDDEMECLRSLQFDNLSADERLSKWMGCVATRLNSFCNNKNSISELWPQYKEPTGYKLLESDFYFVYGVNNNFLENIAEFLDLMLSHVLPKNLKREEDKEILNEVIEKKDQLNQNAICAAVFYLLQSLLPNGKDIRIVNESSKRKRIQKNFTLKEARDAFIIVCPTITHYKKHYDSKVKRQDSVEPYVTIVGSLFAPTDIYVDFEDITYKMVSLSKAIDICFKAYNLFQIEYAPAARLMWQYINMEFYHLPDTPPKPAVHILAKLVEDAKKQTSERGKASIEWYPQESHSDSEDET